MTIDGGESVVRFATKGQAVYDEIRRRILTGTMDPGTPLNQDALAPELGVSVTPVREAVRRLEAEGLVRFEAHKTVIVAPLSRGELQEIYDVRLQLDPHAAALAATRINDEALDKVHELASARAPGDALQQLALNRTFHRHIYAASGNELLVEILDSLWERTDRYRIVLLRRDFEVMAAGREHIEIADAMRDRKPRVVARLVRDHVAKAQGLIERALD
jgi:DNA-binding GntR family transcriptional regulator